MTTEERLEKLERELAARKKRNRWLLGLLALVGAGCLLTGASLHLYDRDGKVTWS